jgi:hypothetical protein
MFTLVHKTTSQHQVLAHNEKIWYAHVTGKTVPSSTNMLNNQISKNYFELKGRRGECGERGERE